MDMDYEMEIEIIYFYSIDLRLICDRQNFSITIFTFLNNSRISKKDLQNSIKNIAEGRFAQVK